MKATTEVRVRYAETDQMGVVYYANYLIWFELGRVEFLRALGYDYSRMEAEDGCILPVVEAKCRYRSPARYDDVIRIEAFPVMLRGSVLKFGYRIVRVAESGATLLAEGETVHVVCDRAMQRCPLPETVAERIRAAMVEQKNQG